MENSERVALYNIPTVRLQRAPAQLDRRLKRERDLWLSNVITLGGIRGLVYNDTL